MDIKQAHLDDWLQIRQIYIEGICTKNATFETEENVPSDGVAWFSKKVAQSILKAVNDNGRFLGWAALSPVSSRQVYKGVAEVSVYIDQEARGQGVGKALLHQLVAQSESLGIWTLQASIFPENQVSIHIHQTEGFRIVGTREKIAKLDNQWRDTTFMERRSSAII